MTIFRNLRTVKEELAKPKFPTEITLQQDGFCCKCVCDYDRRISRGSRAMWAGPGTGRVWHLICPTDADYEYSYEPCNCRSCSWAEAEW